MQAKLLQLANRLEALSLRERAMTLAGIPVALVAAAELLVFGPARVHAAEAVKQAEGLQGEVTALSATLAAQPAVAPLPAADQLQTQRQELQARIDMAGAVMASLNQSVDWGTVVRAVAAGTPGLMLTQLKTMPAEVVFAPSMIKPVAATAAGSGASAVRSAATAVRAAATNLAPIPAAAPDGIETIYRHRADLTVTGDFGALLGYLQTLQQVPGDLRWDRLQLGVAGYPQASAQLTLYTLSTRGETPFN